MPANTQVKHSILEIVYDRLAALDFPDGYDEVLQREIDRAVNWCEQKLRTSLSPVRRTDLPSSAEEAYRNRGQYVDQIDPHLMVYPEWDQLTDAQRSVFNNMSGFYRPGSLPWDSLSTEQQMVWATNVQYAANKVGPAERLDGRGISYIRLYRGRVTELYSLQLQFPNVPGYQTHNLFGRRYARNELILYETEGAIRIFPAMMSRMMAGGSGDAMWTTQFTATAPRIPQSVKVDYEYGFRDPPLDVLEAVALRVCVVTIPQISAMLTAGLGGFGVDGFNVSFNNGMFDGLLKGYQEELSTKLNPYYIPYMTGW